MQTPCRHCRCKKTQTPSGHEPKTAQTASQKTLSRTFGIHIKQSLEPQSTCPAYGNTIWTLQMQKDPNTIDTRAENRPNRKPKNSFTHLWNPHKTIFGATEHMPSLWKHHLDTADAKRPKHHRHTSRKPPKPQPQAKKRFHVKRFHVTFGSDIIKTI